MEGTLYVHNDVTKEFEHAYMSRFGQDIQLPWAANTYDFILLAGKSLGGFSKRPAPDQILSALSGGEAEIGAGGPYHFVDSPKEGKYFEYPIVVKKLIDGEFREVFKKTSFK